MDMKRIINVFSIVVLFCLCAAARPAGDWKVYSTFNDWHKRVIDTKDRVYHGNFVPTDIIVVAVL